MDRDRGPVPACSTRWIATGGTVNVVPGRDLSDSGAPSSDSRSSRTWPETTAIAGRGVVVVMKAGVLVLAPADHPGVDVLVVPDLLVHARVVGVAHEVLPALGRRGQRGAEAARARRLQAHTAAPTRVADSRAFSIRRDLAPVGSGSSTGRSEP